MISWILFIFSFCFIPMDLFISFYFFVLFFFSCIIWFFNFTFLVFHSNFLLCHCCQLTCSLYQWKSTHFCLFPNSIFSPFLKQTCYLDHTQFLLYDYLSFSANQPTLQILFSLLFSSQFVFCFLFNCYYYFISVFIRVASRIPFTVVFRFLLFWFFLFFIFYIFLFLYFSF